MDENQGGGLNSLPPFLIKTYDMVNDSSTDSIISWTPSNKSFVVRNQPEFSSDLLPKFFKHSNFSSFVRQLNTYGFRKIDPEQWEFSNEDFVRGQPHLMKNIHRRKPVHSHSLQGNVHGQGMSNLLTEVERRDLEHETERLRLEKEQLHMELQRHEQEHLELGLQMNNLKDRFQRMQQQMQVFISLVARLLHKPELSLDLLPQLETPERKRRLPKIAYHNGEDCIKDNQMGTIRKNMDCSFDPVLEKNCELFDASLIFWESIIHDFDSTTSHTVSSSLLELNESVIHGISCSQVNRIDMNVEPVRTVGPESVASKDQAAATNAPAVTGVNDVFWEQFLTENPGSSDPQEVQSARKDSNVSSGENKQIGYGKFWWNLRNVNSIVEHMGHFSPAEKI